MKKTGNTKQDQEKPPFEGGTEVMDVDAEEVFPEKELEEQIENELIKHNVTEAFLSKLEADYSNLKIKDFDDKEGYLEVQQARKHTKGIRVNIQKICKKGREWAVREQKKWVAKQEELIARVEKIEAPLEKQEKEFEAEQNRLKEEKRAQGDRNFATRLVELNKLGAVFNGSEFILGEGESQVVYDASAIRETSEEIYQRLILPKYKSLFDAAEKVRLEEQARKDEQAREFQRQQDLLKKQQDELELQKQAISDQQKLIDQQKEKQQQEEKRIAQQKRDEKIRARIAQLSDLGLRFDGRDNHYKGYDVFIPVLDIQVNDDEQWDAELQKVTTHVNAMKQKEEDRKKIVELGNSRWASLQVFGLPRPEFTALGVMSEEEWQVFYNAQKSIYDKAVAQKAADDLAELNRQNNEKKQALLDAASDKEKWSAFVSALQGVIIPEFKSKSYKEKAQWAKDFLDGLK